MYWNPDCETDSYQTRSHITQNLITMEQQTESLEVYANDPLTLPIYASIAVCIVTFLYFLTVEKKGIFKIALPLIFVFSVVSTVVLCMQIGKLNDSMDLVDTRSD
jgi:hypothetical protein